MEGVGARLGRSSTRYGPATIFTGPVRKWKKKWVPVANANGGAGSHQGNINGSGNNGSHLVLYKWTPVSSSGNASSAAPGGTVAADKGSATDESPPRKFRYIPVYMMEEQKVEESPKAAGDGETKARKLDEKSIADDVPMEEPEGEKEKEKEKEAARDANLDLSLGLNSHDSDRRG